MALYEEYKKEKVPFMGQCWVCKKEYNRREGGMIGARMVCVDCHMTTNEKKCECGHGPSEHFTSDAGILECGINRCYQEKKIHHLPSAQPPTKQDWEEKLWELMWLKNRYREDRFPWLQDFISQEIEKEKKLAEERGYKRGRKEGQMEGYTDGLKEGVKDRAMYDRYADEGTLGNSKKDLLAQLRTIIEGKKKENGGYIGKRFIFKDGFNQALEDILEEINKLEERS